MSICDWTMVRTIHELFWHEPFYVLVYSGCLLSLLVFWKHMKRGRRFFLTFSVLCLVMFIYNPIFVNLVERFLLHGDRVVVRLFLLLPILSTEAYVFALLTSLANKKSKILAIALSIAFSALLFFFGIAPWQREEKGWGSDMYLFAENAYKIPQEHIDICDAVLNDMDGNRAVLCMYEMHGINDLGGTLNYSIRMYTSRIQLDQVIDLVNYQILSDEERTSYWNEYISKMQNLGTDSSAIYFIFPLNDERASDLLTYGCNELPVDSQNYQVLVYVP